MIGKQISHYKILEELGRGGMGTVYKARDTKLDRFVALKFLPPHLSRDEENKKRFVHEAKAASALNHPNIATIYEIDEADRRMFIAMEYIEGRPLQDKIHTPHSPSPRGELKGGVSMVDGKPLPMDDAIDYAIQIAEGLAKAHEKGIVHRDIKPANILTTNDNQVKIVDFGLAKFAGRTMLTKEGMTLGTASYMSPEQTQGVEVDHRADIWALGAVMFEMISGQQPFKGDYEQAVMYSILNEDPEPLTGLRAGVPMQVEHIVNRALVKLPEERYQTTADLLSELQKVKRNLTDLGRSAKIPAQQGATPVGLRTHLVLSAAVIASILALAAIAVYFFQGRSLVQKIQTGRTQQITRDTGLEIDPAISPDGKFMAYAAGPLAKMDIYVRQVAGGRSIKLTEDLHGNHRWPRWSPDGTRILFLSSQTGRNTIYVVPALGGVLKGVAQPAPNALHFSAAAPGIVEGSPIWSPSGQHIAYAEGNTIYKQSLASGTSQKITDTFLPHSMSWSPDGARIAFVSGNSEYIFGTTTFANGAPSSIWVVSATSGDATRVTDNHALNISPVWLPDGKHLLFISNEAGSRDLYQIRLDKSNNPLGPPVRLTTGLDAHTASLSQDGMKLAYSKFSYNSNIWSIRIPERSPVSISEAQPVTRGNQNIEGLDISRDGQWLAFDSNRSGNADIYKMPVTGGEPVQLTTHAADDYTPSWSPDQKEIAFHSFRNGNRDVFVISVDRRSEQQVTGDPAQERFQDWSADGNRIVFHSDKTGRQELYITSRAGKTALWQAPMQLTFDVGDHPRWSPDGSLIAYLCLVDSSLRIISPDGGKPTVLFRSPNSAKLVVPAFVGWSTDSRTVYYKAFDVENHSSFWSIPITGGSPKLLVCFDDPALPSHRPEFATDGKRFYFTVGKLESDIWVMELKTDE